MHDTRRVRQVVDIGGLPKFNLDTTLISRNQARRSRAGTRGTGLHNHDIVLLSLDAASCAKSQITRSYQLNSHL